MKPTSTARSRIDAARHRAMLRLQVNGVLADVDRDDACAILADLLIERESMQRPIRGRVGVDQGRSTAIIDALRVAPRTPIRVLAGLVYGAEDRATQSKVRSLLSALKCQERAKNVGPGAWEATIIQ